MAATVKFNPNNGKPLAAGQSVTFQGKTYTGGSTAIGGVPSGSSSSPSSGGGSVTISSANLKVGSTGQAVKELQTKLGIKADGIFGHQTDAAVKAYQSANGLKVDGIVGVNTAGSMNSISSTINPANPTQPLTTPFNIEQPTYTVQPGDLYNPYTGKPLVNAQPGTVIQKDKSKEDYSKAGDTQSTFYNATTRNPDWEKRALREESVWANEAVSSGNISSQFMSTITSDPSIIGFYVNALAYGGYKMEDILNDMKRRELISQGNTSAKDLKIIDPEMNKNTYLSTADGQKSVTLTSSIIPTFKGLLNQDILKYGIDIPDELFKTLVPILDKNSQEFKDAVAKVKATYFDLATSQLQATTEQEKAIADYNMKNFTEQLNKQYGIKLSDDATKAWSQLEELESSMSTRGLAGSGMEQENIDNILRDVRKQDTRLRDQKLTEAEAKKAEYYATSASAAEIAALTPEERQKYGLTPSAEILQKYSIENLKKENPSWSDEMIKKVHDAMIDENGNYRSALYSKYYSKVAETSITQEDTARATVIEDAQNKELEVYRNYDQSQQFGAQTTGDKATIEKNAITTPATTELTPEQTKAAADAAKNIINIDSNPGQTLQPGQQYSYQGNVYTQPGGTTTGSQNTTPSTPTPSTSTPPTTTPSSPTTTPTTNLNNVINIDSNPGQRLPSGQKYSYKGVIYTQP